MGKKRNSKPFKYFCFITIISCLNVFRCGLSAEEMENDFAALSCAQNLPPEKFSAISETCEQVLWRFKLNLTTSSMFLAQIDKACSRDTEKLNSCKNRYPGPDNAGHYMSCLIDEKLNGELKPACENFLTQVWVWPLFEIRIGWNWGIQLFFV